MIRVLVLEQTAELSELMGLYLTALVSAEVTSTHRLEVAMAQLERNTVDVLVVNQNYLSAGLDTAYRSWRERNPEAPLVLIGESPKGERAHFFLQSHKLVQDCKDMLKAPFWRKLAGEPAELPLPLSPNLVYRLGTCPADLFLKLGENNWVKLFHKDSPFGEEEQKKFEAKKLKEIYILPSDIHIALAHFENILSSLKASSEISEQQLVSDATEFMWNALRENSFSEPLKKIATHAIRHSLALVRAEPQLKGYLEKISRPEHQWLVRHSLIITHVACGIATKLGWTSEQTYLKIATAALLHDMCLPRMDQDEEVWLLAATGEKLRETMDRELKEFLQHSTEASQLVRHHKGIPPDTDKIILEHHELPDGTGFPRGLIWSQISPLGSVFILAHAVATILLNEPDSKLWSLELLKDRLSEERWGHGHFKKALQALEKANLFA